MKREQCDNAIMRGALRSGADLPTQQLTRDAERITSRRHSFLRTFRRVFALFGRPSRPLLRRQESGQTGPQKPPSPRCRSHFRPQTLRHSASASRRPVSESRRKGCTPLQGKTRHVGSGSTDADAAGIPAGIEHSKRHNDNQSKRLHRLHGCYTEATPVFPVRSS